MSATFYKVTADNGTAFHGGSGKWTLNRWRSVKGELIACQNGLHLCTRDQLAQWLGPVIWEAEVDGETLYATDKTVARRARVIRRLDTWNERTARLFAADCAERVLPIFEKYAPKDDRPRKAIEAARAYARGEIGDKERDAARDAARAARAAAWVGGVDAARAAGAAAWSAAWSAASAAWAAARDAARDAAGDAAWAAAWAAAGDAFYKWATDRLFDYLEGRAS